MDDNLNLYEEVVPLASPSGEGPSCSKTSVISENFDMQQAMKAMQEKMDFIFGKLAPPETSAKRKLSDSNLEEDVLNAPSKSSKTDDGYDLDHELSLLFDEANAVDDPSDCLLLDQDSQSTSVFDTLVSNLELGHKTGPMLQEKVAGMVTNICKEKLSKQKLKEKFEKYEQPSNVELLIAPQVNPPVWEHLQVKTRTSDLKLQKIQLFGIKAMTVLSLLVNDVVAAKGASDKEMLLSRAMDALAFLGTSNRDINMLRREYIRPELNQEFRNICSRQIPVSTLLFGDDFAKLVRETADANKMKKQCLGPFRGPRNVPRGSSQLGRGRGRGRESMHYSRPFLGQRYRRPMGRQKKA